MPGLAPTAAPPHGNVPAPINVGATPQTKAGNLTVGGVFTANSAVHLAGNVGIGTTTPGALLHIVDRFAAGGRNLTIGDDTFLSDIDVANTLGLYGLQDSTQGHIRLGSAGPVISGFSGNVGIGTTAPGTRLDVVGNIRATGETIGTLGSGFGQFRAIAGNYGSMLRNDGNHTWFLLTALGDQYGIWNTLRPFRIDNATGDAHIGNSALFVQHAGNVGIGTTAPTQRLHVVGNVLAAAYLHTSDRNLKTEIKPLENNLARILNLNPVSFRWRENNEIGIGLLAQDVETIFPEIVHTAKDSGLKSVNYSVLIAPLIQAIQEQQEQIESQQEQIEDLRIKIKGRKE